MPPKFKLQQSRWAATARSSNSSMATRQKSISEDVCYQVDHRQAGWFTALVTKFVVNLYVVGSPVQERRFHCGATYMIAIANQNISMAVSLSKSCADQRMLVPWLDELACALSQGQRSTVGAEHVCSCLLPIHLSFYQHCNRNWSPYAMLMLLRCISEKYSIRCLIITTIGLLEPLPHELLQTSLRISN